METTEIILSQTEAFAEAERLSRKDWYRDSHIYVIQQSGGYVIYPLKEEKQIPGVVKYRNGIKTTYPLERS